MKSLFDIPNPDETIKKFIEDSIKKKQNKSQQFNTKMQNQLKNNIYYTELQTKPKFTVTYVGLALLTIMSDILYGFSEAINKMKSNIDNQKGGKSINNNNISGKQLLNQGDKLNNVVEKTRNRVEKLKNDITTNNRYDTKDFNKKTNLAKDIGLASFKTGIKWSQEFINYMFELGMNIIGEKDILDTPFDELSPKLNKNLLLIASVLKELSENPATKEAVKEIAQAIGTTVIEIMEEIKPELNKITDESLVMLNQVGEKAIRGAAATSLSFGQAFLAEIPYLGGVIDLMLAIGKGFNSFMEVYKTFSDKGGVTAVTTAKAIKGTEETVNRGINRIDGAINNAKDKINNAKDKINNVKQMQSNILPNASNSTNSIIQNVNNAKNNAINNAKNKAINNSTNTLNNNLIKGGTSQYNSNKDIRNKIMTGGKRLNKTMKLFYNTLPRQPYIFGQKNIKGNKSHKKNKRTYKRKR